MVCADSAFASVEAAVRLREQGLHFMGIVKTSHRLFPRKYLQQDRLYTDRGDYVVLTTEHEGQQLLAVGWKDAKIQTLISTRGGHNSQTPVQTEWTGPGMSTARELRVPMPKLVGEYFQCAQGVDVHNHTRQGHLAVEGLVEASARYNHWNLRYGRLAVLSILQTHV